MSKCFDDYKEFIDDMSEKIKHGKMDGKALEGAYMCMCAGYLAYIVDKLDEIALKLGEKEDSDYER